MDHNKKSNVFLIVEGSKYLAQQILAKYGFSELYIQEPESKEKLLVNITSKSYWPVDDSLITKCKDLALEAWSVDIPTIHSDQLNSHLNK